MDSETFDKDFSDDFITIMEGVFEDVCFVE